MAEGLIPEGMEAPTESDRLLLPILNLIAPHPFERDWVAIELSEMANLHDATCRDRVPASKIVAYAKFEKEFPVEKHITAEELEQVENFVSNKLGFATQFDDLKDNVLMCRAADKYQIRVSFNKDKISGRESEISDFFDQFQSV